MAELSPGAHLFSGARLSRNQFLAIAWLRWRMYANGFRRKGGVGELIGRILLAPFLLALIVTPTLLAGFFAWAAAMKGQLDHIDLVFWGAFAFTQLLNINLSPPGTTFDPTDLIRFPVALPSYVFVRLTFGLLSPANVVVTLMSAAIFTGVTIDRPHLWPWTLVATLAFALANVLFTRMIFAWVDRWLSTRRAREVFTGLIFAGSLGFQYLNLNYNPGLNHGRHRNVSLDKLNHAQTVFHQVHPLLRLLPPELSGSAIIAAEHAHRAISLQDTALVALYAAVFLAIYALRMRTEYRGENLSDQANAVARTAPISPAIAIHPTSAPALAAVPVVVTRRIGLLPATLGPLLQKELLLLRRNTGLLYGIIAPTVMVFLFAGRLSLRASHWVLPIAAAYTLLGLAPMSFNSFGLEGAGAQFYFMAPIPLREVFFAKNVMHFLLAAFEVLTVIAIITYITGRPTLADGLFVILWASATVLFTTTLGNLRSVSAPKKANPGRTISRNQSQLSVWIAFGILIGCAALGAGFLFLAAYLHKPWISAALSAALAAGAAVIYHQGLRGIEAYTLQHRESLFEELGKKT
jgi:ABC-2 type transport system permease protein